MERGDIHPGLHLSLAVGAEEEHAQPAGIVPARDSNAQPDHIHPGHGAVPFGVIGAQAVAVPLDRIQDGFKTGAVPFTGKSAAQDIQRIDIGLTLTETLPGLLHLVVHPLAELDASQILQSPISNRVPLVLISTILHASK